MTDPAQAGELRISEDRYAVRYADRFALGDGSQYKLFFKHKDARAFAKELETHINTKCRVVRVTITICERPACQK